MKKTILTICLSALIALPLAGCSGDNTGDHPTEPVSPSPTAPAVTPDTDDQHSPEVPTLPPVGDNDGTGGTDVNGDGQEDLAGPDGMVGDDDPENSDAGRSRRSALERVGDGIRDTVDDIGQGAENILDDMGRGARSAADQMGRSAQETGRDAQRALR